jgi:hypothetical protein
MRKILVFLVFLLISCNEEDNSVKNHAEFENESESHTLIQVEVPHNENFAVDTVSLKNLLNKLSNLYTEKVGLQDSVTVLHDLLGRTNIATREMFAESIELKEMIDFATGSAIGPPRKISLYKILAELNPNNVELSELITDELADMTKSKKKSVLITVDKMGMDYIEFYISYVAEKEGMKEYILGLIDDNTDSGDNLDKIKNILNEY